MFYLRNVKVSNFRSIQNASVSFGENKTVFVGKNNSGKSNILKALEKIFNKNSHAIKADDFYNKDKKIKIKIEIEYKNELFFIYLEAKIIHSKIETSINDVNNFLGNTSFIYIPSDRSIKNSDTGNWYKTLINIILKNKEQLKEIENIKKEKKSLKELSSKKNSTLIITLLKLYLRSIEEINTNKFKLFIIDQPENFLHPHATKVIDKLLQEIGEKNNTQIIYSTHSTDLVSNFRKNKYEIHDIVFTRKQGDKSIYKKIENKYGKYNKIMISLIFKNAGVFFSDAVILTEGETEKISIPNIYENYNWSSSDLPLDTTYKNPKDFFNLDLNNISLIDVGGKGALSDWYSFASEVFGPEKVFAIIDQDSTYSSDKIMIAKAIKNVHSVTVKEKQYKKYNWIVLQGEFENYYNKKAIEKFLQNTIQKRAENKFGNKLNQKKVDKDFRKLWFEVNDLNASKKISVAYEKLFNKYFKKYGKPTIAFHLSTWLCNNDGYKPEFIQILKEIIWKIQGK